MFPNKRTTSITDPFHLPITKVPILEFENEIDFYLFLRLYRVPARILPSDRFLFKSFDGSNSLFVLVIIRLFGKYYYYYYQ